MRHASLIAKAQRKWDAVKKRPKTDAVREKRRKVIARVHERIRNKRHNFAHQESRKIVNRHGFIAPGDYSHEYRNGKRRRRPMAC